MHHRGGTAIIGSSALEADLPNFPLDGSRLFPRLSTARLRVMVGPATLHSLSTDNELALDAQDVPYDRFLLLRA